MSEQRERFEAWARTKLNGVGGRIYLLGKHDNGTYKQLLSQAAWEGYKAACPEGCVAVPKEPSQKMLHTYERSSIAPIGPLSIHGYRMMLSAAQKPGDA